MVTAADCKVSESAIKIALLKIILKIAII